MQGRGVAGVVAERGEVRGDVDRARGDRYRSGEVDLLPAGRGLVGERRGGELGPGRAPEGAGVDPGVAGALVEPDAGDLAVDVGLELHHELDAGAVCDARVRRRGRGGPDRAGGAPGHDGWSDGVG